MKNCMSRVLLIITITVMLPLMSGCEKKEPADKPTDSVPAARVKKTESSKASTPTVSAALGQPAAKLDGLTWIKGQPVTFQSGKIYVVEFWATWCGPCKLSIPHLTKIQKQYQEKGVTVIGVSNEKNNLETVKEFVAEQGDKMDYAVAVDTTGKVNSGYMEAYGQQYIPTAFIVDGTGKVVWYGNPLEDLEGVLAQVTAGTFDLAAYAKAKAEREALERQVKTMVWDYIDAVRAGKPIDQTRPMAAKLIEIAPAGALNQMAWYLLTEIEEPYRDYPIALKMAEKANTLTGDKEAAYLDTYALALFKNNKIAEAIAVQTRAVELAADDEVMKDELQGRLKEFKAALEK